MASIQAREAALSEYRQIGLEAQVEEATPHRLIQLMMERALAKILLAKNHVEEGNIAEKGSMIGDAVNIISGLQQCLNYDADEKLAGNFDALYDYMLRRLLHANLQNDVQALVEVSDLLRELKEAWDAIEDKE